jgi:hypothetical protein
MRYGAFVDERRIVAADEYAGGPDKHAPLVASFAVNVPQAGSRRDDAPRRTCALIAAFRCAALARCSLCVNGPRIVAGIEGGRVSHRRACASLVASLAAGRSRCGMLAGVTTAASMVGERKMLASPTRPASWRQRRRPCADAGRQASTSARAPGSVVHRGRSDLGRRRVLPCARLEIEQIGALFAPSCSSPPSLRYTPELRRVADERRIVAPAKAVAYGREKLIFRKC